MSTRSVDDLPAGARVFIDATILIYHFAGQSLQCRHLLERCDRRELNGVTSVVAFNEACHRLMIMEAVHAGVVTGRDLARKLRDQPGLVRGLRRHVEQLRRVVSWGIEVLPVDVARCLRAADLRAMTGLLTNDSVILATMRDERLDAIATADVDFIRLEGVRVYRPTDLGSPVPPLA